MNALKVVIAVSLLLAPCIAPAHSLDTIGGGFAAGLGHPFGGLDHLLAMLAAGLWAVRLGGAGIWLLPASFLAMLVAGALLGMAGVTMPLVEPAIALSVLLSGFVLLLSVRASVLSGSLAVGLFALFHGHAHGVELTSAVSPAVYLLGVAASSAALHLAGIGIGQALRGSGWLLRSGEAMLAGAGVWLMVNV